jgi:hypothetical protein
MQYPTASINPGVKGDFGYSHLTTGTIEFIKISGALDRTAIV